MITLKCTPRQRTAEDAEYVSPGVPGMPPNFPAFLHLSEVPQHAVLSGEIR
jgi:hypothetical protein